MSKKRGLPQDKKMRHSEHFIDTLFSRDDSSVGKMIAIENLVVNSSQPRKNLGELDGLIQSIQNYGILEPLLVEPLDSCKYKIIAGERRYHAALACGLSHLPCIEFPLETESQSLELALVENLQRQDLDPFEEALAFMALHDKYGYTHEQIAQKIGKKRSTISEIIAIANLPDEIKELCRHADITSKSTLLEIAKCDDLLKMRQLIDAVMNGKGREVIRRIRKGNSDAEKYGYFVVKSENASLDLKIRIDKDIIKKEDVIEFLKTVIKKLECDEITLKQKSKEIKKTT